MSEDAQAFPVPAPVIGPNGDPWYSGAGMSLRAYIATAFTSNPLVTDRNWTMDDFMRLGFDCTSGRPPPREKWVARAAVRHADALIAELNRAAIDAARGAE